MTTVTESYMTVAERYMTHAVMKASAKAEIPVGEGYMSQLKEATCLSLA
jgi:hypothetical protein